MSWAFKFTPILSGSLQSPDRNKLIDSFSKKKTIFQKVWSARHKLANVPGCTSGCYWMDTCKWKHGNSKVSLHVSTQAHHASNGRHSFTKSFYCCPTFCPFWIIFYATKLLLNQTKMIQHWNSHVNNGKIVQYVVKWLWHTVKILCIFMYTYCGFGIFCHKFVKKKIHLLFN